MSARVLVPFFVLLCLIGGCNKNGIPEETYEFEHQEWSEGMELTFHPFANPDLHNNSSRAYNVTLIVRYSERCPFSSLPIELQYPFTIGNVDEKKTLILNLFDNNDYADGQGHYGVFETSEVIFDSIPSDPDFYFIVSPLTPRVEGILSVSARIDKLDL